MRSIAPGPWSLLAWGLFFTTPIPSALADERSDAERALERAAAARDTAAAQAALGPALAPGDERAARFLLRVAPALRGLDLHASLLDAFPTFQDAAAVGVLATAASSNANAEVRYLLVEGLARQGSEPARKAVLEALDDRADIVALAAARAARLLAAPETVGRLIDRLEKAERKPAEASLVREIQGALKALTGQDIPRAEIWKSWWAANQATWQPPAARQPEPDRRNGSREGTVIDRLRKDRPEDAETVTSLPNDRVVVVRGARDKIGDVLDAIRVPHRDIRPDDIRGLSLDPRSVLVLNCNAAHDPYTDTEHAKIRDFVSNGGYLFTSDWELSDSLQEIFPGTIRVVGKSAPDPFKATIVPAAPAHPLLRDLFPMTTWDPMAFTWFIDENSELIKVESPGVTVLVISPDLEEKYKAPAVAITFRWQADRIVAEGAAGAAVTGGRRGPAPGAVLHVMSHFEKQRDADSGDHFALQQLLLNFVLEKDRQNRGG